MSYAVGLVIVPGWAYVSAPADWKMGEASPGCGLAAGACEQTGVSLQADELSLLNQRERKKNYVCEVGK